ncbi:hypothetical protein AVEN_41376-1, partial [Araneus ventricosus]
MAYSPTALMNVLKLVKTGTVENWVQHQKRGELQVQTQLQGKLHASNTIKVGTNLIEGNVFTCPGHQYSEG